jgi:outer membrane biosynthesis protein TonB
MKIICACVSLLFLGGGLAAQAPEPTRFKDPEGITADPTGLLRDTSDPLTRLGPRFPSEFMGKGIIGESVVAFVIDTTGRVELETASFLNTSRPEFEKAVCEFLPTARFQPFVVVDRKWRVLLVESFAFNTLAMRDTASLHAASALSARSQEEFSTEPIGKVVAHLVPLPHCDALASAAVPPSVGVPPSDIKSSAFGRFGDPEEIIPVSLATLKPPIVRAPIKYPPELESMQLAGAAIFAFVVDTTGAVEPGTVTFLNGPRAEFAAAVCMALPKYRYAPVVVEGRRRRALVVLMSGFLSREFPDRSIVPDASSLRSRIEENFAAGPIVTVTDQLEGLPHCDGR